jgi:hypothetical protein
MNLRTSRSKRNFKSEARSQQKLRVEEFNNLRLLKVIPDRENKSMSMENLWAWGGCGLDHTKMSKQCYIYIYIYIEKEINIHYCNE